MCRSISTRRLIGSLIIGLRVIRIRAFYMEREKWDADGSKHMHAIKANNSKNSSYAQRIMFTQVSSVTNFLKRNPF